MRWSLAAVLAVVLGTAADARGQEAPPQWWHLADVGIYAGGAFGSPWFESRPVVSAGNGDEAFGPGLGPMLGLQLTYWPRASWWGVRLHGAYAAMQLPSVAGRSLLDTGERADYTLNGYLADLSVVVRPFRRSGTLSSLYLWAGGGGLLVDQAGEDAPTCQPTLRALAACLSQQPGEAAVGQGTAGVGVDLLRLTLGLTLFAEAGVHVYDSPVHVGSGWIPPPTAPPGTSVRAADDALAVTGRMSFGVKMVFGFVEGPPMVPPPPLPPPPAPRQPDPPPMNGHHDIRVCVLENGSLRLVELAYNPVTGDSTTLDGRLFPRAYPVDTTYAVGAPWYINNEPIRFGRLTLTKYGLPRILGINELTPVGEYRGVTVFAEAGAAGPPDVIYIPVRTGCEFQPYQSSIKTGGVRG